MLLLNKRGLRYISISLLMMFHACTQLVSGISRVGVDIEHGQLDLSKANFDSQVYDLAGDVWFYPNKKVDNNGAALHGDSRLITTNRSWNNQPEEYKNASKYGYGSYVFKVKIPDSLIGEVVVLRPKHFIAYASELYVNGQLASYNGSVGSSVDDPNYQPYRKSTIIPVVANSSVLNIVIHVANFDHFRGGVFNEIEFGKADVVIKQADSDTLYDLIVVISLLIMFMYHVVLFSVNLKDKTSLFFAFTCLIFAIDFSFQDMMTFFLFFPQVSFGISSFLHLIMPFLLPSSFLLFLYSLFPTEVSRRLRNLTVLVSVILISLTFILGLRMASMFVKPHFMYVLIIVIYVLVVIIQAVKNKREGAGLFFIAYLIFSLCAINDILNIFEVYSTQSMVSPGLVIFVFLLSVLQGKKMINMNHRNNVLSSNLKMLNKELENKVSNRTLELKESLHKLQELDSYKENMTHMLVHDLKAPLNSIVNCNILPDSERTEVIQQSGSQLLNLVQNMLDVYKSEKAELPLNITSFLFSELISGAVGEISVSLKVRELSVNFNQVVDYKLMADRILMHRVVVNILINATKFAPAKSVIRINSKLNREGVLRVGIYNSGPSISKKDQLEIFNLFKQTKHGIKNAGSTGLGLAFCKLAIVAHKGNIGVESNGVGAEFWFSISSVNALDSVGDKSIVVFDGEFALTSDDKCLLKAISEQLVGVELYNITQIKKVLHGFENKNKAISNWLSKVEEAAYSGDVVSYNNLIKLPYT